MQQLKDRRSAEERCAVLRTRLRTLQTVTKRLRIDVGSHELTEFLPKIPDYALMPEFRILMEASTEDVIDAQALVDLTGRLRELELPWVIRRQKRLARMLEKASGRLPEDADEEPPEDEDLNDTSHRTILHLAISTFECHQCSERFHATDAMVHRCTRGDGRLWLLDSLHETEGTYMYEVRRISRTVRPWNVSCLRVPDLEPLRRVIQTCGKDPATATEEDMDKPETRLVVKGQLVDGKRKVMTWDIVVSYLLCVCAY